MLNVQCDVNISLARELPPLTLRCMTHGAVRNDPVHDEVSVLVPQIDPSVPQPVFTIREKVPTRAFFWLKAPTSAFTFKTGLVSIVSYSCPSLMIIASRTQFHVERPWGQRPFSIVS